MIYPHTKQVKQVLFLFRLKVVLDLNHLEYAFLLELNPLNANRTKWSNNCLSVFDHFLGLALKGLSEQLILFITLYLEFA